eukprot:GHVN01058700.1.p1 GENE.GHVN01058700.1~~GHVN01058700.1.p1  ORF type:complete len:137 (+),score=23.30 GHVN01058700.1:360-770(+)
MKEASNTTTILFCTSNEGKLKEVRSMLEGTSVSVKSSSIDLPEFQGTSEEVTREKCKAAFREIGRPVVVEDTSLGFSAFGGLPGPYIKWFLKNLGPEGLPKLLSSFEDKTATALCIFGYWDGSPRSEPCLFFGSHR